MNFLSFFDFNQPASFSSPYPLDEAIARLSQTIQRSSPLFDPRARVIGEVTATSVVLSVYHFHQNSFAPYYYGQFRQQGGQSVLEGRFSFMGPLPIVLFLLTISMVGLAVAGLVGWGMVPESINLLILFGALLFLGIMFLATAIGKAFAKDDIGQISKTIQQSIGEAHP